MTRALVRTTRIAMIEAFRFGELAPGEQVPVETEHAITSPPCGSRTGVCSASRLALRIGSVGETDLSSALRTISCPIKITLVFGASLG